MSVIGLQHVSISVADLDRSIEFYADLLGLNYLGTQWMIPEQVYEIFGLQGTKVRYGWFKAGRSGVIELLEFDPQSNTPNSLNPNRPGQLHFALQVRNLDEMYKQLMEQGVEGLVKPRMIQGGSKVAFIKDPDGLVIKLIDMGLFMLPRIHIFSGVFGFFERMKRKRASQMAPGACREGNGK
jgi:catechol 2,3-dioxygenase-like lactoylglutathione lyase family enzyme